MSSIRQMVDEARESYRVTNDGLVTAAEELANLEMEREREQDRLDRHGPAGCVNCGQTSGVRPCPLCGS